MRKIILMIVAAMMATLSLKAQSYEPKNEIGVYYGFGSASDIVSTYAGAFSFSSDDQSGFWGPIGIEYFYHVSPVVGVGAVASIAGCKYDHSSFKANYYTVMPAVKFDWLRQKNYGLYSKLAFGLTYMYEQEKQDNQNGEKELHSDSKVMGNFQASLLGIEAGSEKFRGFAELGVGEQGIFVAGCRYKF